MVGVIVGAIKTTEVKVSVGVGMGVGVGIFTGCLMSGWVTTRGSMRAEGAGFPQLGLFPISMKNFLRKRWRSRKTARSKNSNGLKERKPVDAF